VNEALTKLKALGSPADLQIAGEKGLAPAHRPAVNSHIHLPPNFSAFTTVQQVVDLATTQKIGALGVSNYYDYEVYPDFMTLAAKHAIFPLLGLEIISLVDNLVQGNVKINDPGNPGKFYICGKGITRFAPMNAKASQLLGTIRKNDSTRMAAMVDRLAAIFDRHDIKTGLTEQSVIDRVAARNQVPRNRVYLQERHICQAFQERLFDLIPAEKRAAAMERLFGTPTKAKVDDFVAIQNEIRSHLMKAGKPAYVDETFVNFEQAYRLILELGGIPFYPTLADGAKPICGYEDPVEKLITNIKSAGVYCAELIPIRNSPEVLRQYVTAMRAAGIIVTAGTEHNTLELLPIEPTYLKGVPIPDDLKDIFWEGACVVAAHQFLTLHGEVGYVDSTGKLNSNFKTDQSRIEHFRRLGAAVIEKYFQKSGAK
jgi:hypothetical protein